MKISFIVEGESERIFLRAVHEFLRARCQAGKSPRIIARPLNSNVPPRGKLIKIVRDELQDGVDAVIILTDVKGPGNYFDAGDAISKIEASLDGLEQLNVCVFVHAAQHELEAWLIPFWPRIQSLLNSDIRKPATPPELLNHDKPPSRRLNEVFLRAKRIRYSKLIHLESILKGQDLATSANECPGLKALLNRVLAISGAERI
jgi:hypothetical protein